MDITLEEATAIVETLERFKDRPATERALFLVLELKSIRAKRDEAYDSMIDQMVKAAYIGGKKP